MRLPYLKPDDLVGDERDLVASHNIALYQVLSNRPVVLEHVDAFARWIRWECPLDPQLREMAIVYVGLLTTSRYEYSHHIKISLDVGVTPADIDALRALAAGQEVAMGDQERLVLDATYELYNDGVVSDAIWARLVDTLGQNDTMDLVTIVCFYLMLVRMISTFDIEVEPDYETYLERFPLVSPERAV